MKRISILNLILFACTMATAQIKFKAPGYGKNYGLKAGIAASYFDKFPQQQAAGFMGGIYAKQTIKKQGRGEATYIDLAFNDTTVRVHYDPPIPIRFKKLTRFSIQEEISYSGKGGFNPDHDIYFKTHYVQGTILAGINIGCITLQAGGYVARLVRTGNYTYFNHSWNWPHKDWIYNFMDYGTVVGLEINFHGAIGSFQYQHGLRNVINKESAWHPMDGFRNRTLVASLQIPFKL